MLFNLARLSAGAAMMEHWQHKALEADVSIHKQICKHVAWISQAQLSCAELKLHQSTA